MVPGRFVKRRVLQFSLRTFLAVLTGVCIWLGLKVEKVRTQRQVVRLVKSYNGETAFDYDYPPSGAASRSPPGPVWLRLFLGDDYFADLVYVRAQAITDGEVRVLAKQSTLKHLSVSGGITDASLELIGDLGNLETLEIAGARLTAAGLGRLAGLSKLRSLVLSNQALSDEHAKSIGRLTQLTSLSLRDSRIGSKPMEHLKCLTSLTSLDLSGTLVGDQGLKTLYGLKGLKSIELERSMVSDKGLEELRAALPGTQVSAFMFGRGMY